jgi:hypothetical protein
MEDLLNSRYLVQRRLRHKPAFAFQEVPTSAPPLIALPSRIAAIARWASSGNLSFNSTTAGLGRSAWRCVLDIEVAITEEFEG